MTVDETSNRLDVLLEKSGQGIVVDEYVKSLYLTQAQNTFIEGILRNYEYSDRMRHLIGPLLKEVKPSVNIVSAGIYQASLELDIKQIVFEVINGNKTTIPLDWNDIHQTIDNPFREPNEKIAYRTTFNHIAYLYSSDEPGVYTYVYCKIPQPIVLQDLPDDLELQGVSVETESELPDDSMLTVVGIASELIIKNKALFAPKEQKA